MKKRPEWECGRNRSRPCRIRRFRRIRQTDSRIPEQREEMLRLRERKCLRDRRMGRRTKTNKIRMQEGSAVLRESVFPSFIFYSAKDGKNKFVLFSQRFTKRTNLYGMLLTRIGRKGRKSIW